MTVPARDIAAVIALPARMIIGGLYLSCASSAYECAHLAKARFSAPASRIFCTPLISEKLIPSSFALFSIMRRLSRICARPVITPNTEPVRIISNAGSTNAGAKWMIWAMYSSDRMADIPMEKTFPSTVPQIFPTALYLLASSPEE